MYVNDIYELLKHDKDFAHAVKYNSITEMRIILFNRWCPYSFEHADALLNYARTKQEE